ncbi:hypothetical protein Tco_1409053 [Tanacetum coccineum]
MCNDSWGRSSFARCLIEVNSEVDLVDVVTIGIPSLTGDDFIKETIRVEYEWRPPRCDICKIFGHVHDHALKGWVNVFILLLSSMLLLTTVEKYNDGFSQRYEPKGITSAPKKGATNLGNASKSPTMSKTTEDVENVYDETANLFPNTKTGGSSSFTVAAGVYKAVLLEVNVVDFGLMGLNPRRDSPYVMGFPIGSTIWALEARIDVAMAHSSWA